MTKGLAQAMPSTACASPEVPIAGSRLAAGRSGSAHAALTGCASGLSDGPEVLEAVELASHRDSVPEVGWNIWELGHQVLAPQAFAPIKVLELVAPVLHSALVLGHFS